METMWLHRRGRFVSILLLGCLGLAGLLTGCGGNRLAHFTLVPPVNAPLKEPVKGSLEVAVVKDTRPHVYEAELGPDMPGDFADLVSSYPFMADRPVAEIFQEGLNAAFQQNGFETTNAIRYLLNGHIQSFDFADRSDLRAPKCCLWVDFELKNKETGESVWRQTILGDETTANSITTRNFELAFIEAADDVICQLVTNATFRGYFESRPTNAP